MRPAQWRRRRSTRRWTRGLPRASSASSAWRKAGAATCSLPAGVSQTERSSWSVAKATASTSTASRARDAGAVPPGCPCSWRLWWPADANAAAASLTAARACRTAPWAGAVGSVTSAPPPALPLCHAAAASCSCDRSAANTAACRRCVYLPPASCLRGASATPRGGGCFPPALPRRAGVMGPGVGVGVDEVSSAAPPAASSPSAATPCDDASLSAPLAPPTEKVVSRARRCQAERRSAVTGRRGGGTRCSGKAVSSSSSPALAGDTARTAARHSATLSSHSGTSSRMTA